MVHVNAMGKLCPEPVIMTKAEIEKGSAEITVSVDNDIAVSNVTRLLQGKGYTQAHRKENIFRQRSTLKAPR